MVIVCVNNVGKIIKAFFRKTNFCDYKRFSPKPFLYIDNSAFAAKQTLVVEIIII